MISSQSSFGEEERAHVKVAVDLFATSSVLLAPVRTRFQRPCTSKGTMAEEAHHLPPFRLVLKTQRKVPLPSYLPTRGRKSIEVGGAVDRESEKAGDDRQMKEGRGLTKGVNVDVDACRSTNEALDDVDMGEPVT